MPKPLNNSSRPCSVVLGAGPAGLAAARELGHRAILMEKSPEIGGLCRSFEVEGGVFDYGGHAFFTTKQATLQFVERLASNGLYKQRRSAWVWSHERFLPYPFQANLSYLPKAVIEKCLIGLCEERRGAEQSPASTLDQWLERSFGSGITDEFLRAYNAKIWAHPLEEIVPVWAGDRIVTPETDKIIRGALSRQNFRQFPNSEVRYPKRGGFVELYRPLQSHISGRILLNEWPVLIDLTSREIRTNRGRLIHYDKIISTIPLPELVAVISNGPQSLQGLAEELDYNSLFLVNISAERTGEGKKQRIYAADPRVPFHKLVLNHHSSRWLRNRKIAAIQAEISYSQFKPLDETWAVDATLAALRETGVITAETHIRAIDVRKVSLGYPVYTRRTLRAKDVLCAYFEENDVLCVGRFGEWIYINSDAAIERGIAAAAKVLGGLQGSLPRIHQMATS